MAKRYGDNVSSNSKRPKLHDPDDSLWDDDVDDDCFNAIVTKVLEQDEVVSTQLSLANSVPPNYESFRPNIPFSSTQLTATHSFAKPKTPGNNNGEIFEDLKMEVTYLQQKCQAKEGEVTTLRLQMQKVKSEMLDEQIKRQKEYLDNTNAKDKEIKGIKGQLEFKNLEIANLKQRISEISKASSSSVNDNNKRMRIENSKIMMSPISKGILRRSNKSKDTEKGIATFILQEQEFPLLSKFSPEFFETNMPEVHMIETRVNQCGKNTIPYLHNQIVQEEVTLPSGPKITVRVDKKEVDLEYIYPDMLRIIQSDHEGINSKENRAAIHKIFAMSVQLSEYFKHYLELLEKTYRTEDIEQLDKTFLQNNPLRFSSAPSEETLDCNCEIGVSAGKTVQFIAELLPYSSYLMDHLILGKTFKFDEQLLRTFPCLKGVKKKDFYLSLLNDIVRKIFFLRKTDVCQTFLNAIGTLLMNVSKDNLYANTFHIFSELTGSLLFTKPATGVLLKLLIIFKNCSKSKAFVDFLCRKPDSKKFTTDKKRKLIYFIEDSCKFTLFMALLNSSLHDLHDEKILLDIALNVLSFIYNIFVSNPFWMHDQQKDQCICLEQLYQLAIDVSYKTLLRYEENRYTPFKDTYTSICKCSIKIFELLTFNSYELIEKYVENYSRYREICNSLLELQDDLNLVEEVKDLQKLSIFEDVPSVAVAKFDLL